MPIVGVIRHISKFRCDILTKSIMTSSRNFEKVLEKLQTNPYFEKYADKIAELQKIAPQELLQRVEADKSKKEIKKVDLSQYSSVLNPKEKLTEPVVAEDKKLNSIFKVELVLDKNAEEIKSIWEQYHIKKDIIAATISTDIFSVLKKSMKKYPTFLLPLPREQGYEFIMCQTNGNSVHFTPLLAYQVHKENAPECLTMVHYTELEDKGIVLMRGEFDKNVISAKEAQCLANQFQLYYGNKFEQKTQLLESFNKKPDTFKHMDLIQEMENITIP